MYFFGYAPIKVSHEVKYIYHHERIDFKEILVNQIYRDIELEYSGLTDHQITLKLLEIIIHNHWQEFRVEKYNDELRQTTSFRLSFFLGFHKK